jgi:carbon-monoxide dehydrogenase large subunit
VTGAARYAGARVHRVEDERLLTGHGRFVDDVTRPGMLHACFVRSPFARARIDAIDTSEALTLPGVRAVLVAADLNGGVGEQWHSSVGPKSPETPRPPLADDEVRFVGDPVALVVADNRYLAEDASELVVVDYDPQPAVVDYETATTGDELVHEAHGSNVVGEMQMFPPDLEEVFASAAHVVTETFHQQAYAPVPMETRGIVVEWDDADEQLTIWAATQSPHEWRHFCSRLLGLDADRIRVIVGDTGGGFGQKVMVQREDMCLMLAARQVPAPIKWIEDRRENLMSAGQARHEHGTARIAFDADGRILAAAIDHVTDAGAYPTPWPVGPSAAVGMLFPGPYRVPRGGFAATIVYSNTPGRSAYRGPWQFESLAREVLLDIAARQIGIDPIELRRRNVLASGELPYTSPTGFTYDNMTPAETFEHALELLDYEAFRREQAEARAAGRYLGVGTCTYAEPTTPGYGVYGTEGARLRIEPSGAVTVFVTGGSAGNSIETTVVQLVADALSVDIEDVTIVQGDTSVTPDGTGAQGSRSGSMTAGAVFETATALREQMLTLAGRALDAAADDLELSASRVVVRAKPEVGIAYAELAGMAADAPHDFPSGLEASERYSTPVPQIWANATHVCTCEVDVQTGRVTLLRYIVGEDCGPMINPAVVEGQIAGGTVQGIGGALYEHLAYDEDGNPITTTFMDYLLPTSAEVPTIEYGHVETPAPGAGGYKGVGEGGAIGATPAVVNAVADALAPFGVTISRLPLDPATVLGLIPADGPGGPPTAVPR